MNRAEKKPKTILSICPYCVSSPPYEVEEPYFSMYDRSKIKPPYPLIYPNPTDREKKPKYASILHKKYRLNEFSEEEFREILAVYYGMCKKLDDQFGKIVQKLKKLNLYNSTMVISFC